VIGLLLLLCAALTLSAAQPLPFSHQTHASAAKLACQDCHPTPAKFGAAMGFPATAKCMACHILIAKDKPAIRKLAEFAASKQPVPWERVYQLAGFVFFDHRFHLMNEAKCEDCHGPVGERDVTSDELNSTKMAFCQDCHRRTRASGGCNTCHNIK
jgi:hypothetical protein